MASRVYSFTVPTFGALRGKAASFAQSEAGRAAASNAIGFGIAVGGFGGVFGAVAGFVAADEHNSASRRRGAPEASVWRYMAVYGSRGAFIGATAPVLLPLALPYYAFCASLAAAPK